MTRWLSWLGGCAVFAALSCNSAENVGPRPTGVQLAFSGQAWPGDSVPFTVTFDNTDTPGAPVILRLSFNGGPPTADTTQTPPQLEELVGYLQVPSNFPDGTLRLTVVLPTEGDSASGNVTITERPPTVSADVVPAISPAIFTKSSGGGIAFIAGVTDSINIQASDSPFTVGWIGWQLGPPFNIRDSVATSGVAPSAEFAITLPSSTVGSTASLTAFARAGDGTMSEQQLGSASVVAYVNRPVRTAPLPGVIHDIAFDAKRNLLYLSYAGSSSIGVLALASMTYQTAIPLPAQPWGLDLSPGGDSLIVAIANTTDLAFVDLAVNPATVTALHVSTFDASPPDTLRPTQVVQYPRTAADGDVLVLLGGVNYIEGAYGEVGDFNLVTKSADNYGSNLMNANVPAHSGDRSRVLFVNASGYPAVVYDASTHELSDIGTIGSRPLGTGATSASHTGAHYSVGSVLFNSAMTAIDSVGISDDASAFSHSYGSSLGDDDSTFYLGVPALCTGAPCADGVPAFFLRYAYGSSATLREIVNTPEAVLQLVPLAGNRALVGIGPTRIMWFDLTQSSNASPAGIVASRETAWGRSVALVRAPAVRDRAIPNPVSPTTLRVRFGGHEHTTRLLKPSR